MMMTNFQLQNGIYRFERASMRDDDLKYVTEDDILYFSLEYAKDKDRVRKERFKG